MKRYLRPMPFVLAAALAVALLAPASAFAKATLALSSGSGSATVDPGGVVQGKLDVMNAGDEQLQVLIYAADQKVTATGAVGFAMPSRDNPDFGRTPASWVQLKLPKDAASFGNLPYVVLKAGEKQDIAYEIRVPENATPGDHQILLFFEMFDPKKNTSGAVSQVFGRLGSRIIVRVKGQTTEKLDVAPYTVAGPVIGGDIAYAFQINNTGNTDKKCSVVLTVLDSNEAEKLKTTVLSDRPVYAQSAYQVAGKLKGTGLGLGTYTVRLTMTAPKEGSSEPITVVKDRSVMVIPMWAVWTAVGLAVLVLVLLVWWIVRVIRNRGRVVEPAPQEQPPAEPPAQQAAE